jgi:hypothetical protein
LRKSEKLRSIFIEVRRALGREAPASEVLRISNAILESYAEYRTELTATEEERQYRGFFALAVDEAIRDGGWKLLSRDPTFKWSGEP